MITRECEFETLVDNGSPRMVANEIVLLRQRVEELEVDSALQCQQIEKLEVQVKAFIHGFAELCGLGKEKVRNAKV